ncbi:hypothetical protein QRD43_19190 [Pelomonas sp. APW6]|uniref:Lysozyme inhibitor LprI N-terminal domain-containing protein n=1 Tax=Roseateles subflavus TaxID=3053353 RepID=A0ABT7LME0_9BURK|nr:hypothetical protein [Pelomonas sp. APW6]MDL5034033.1 hypothetical protein [Pelomonas sp. APW6]
MLPALLLMAALTPAAAPSASPAGVAACVALRALPAQSLDLLESRGTEDGLAALMALAQTGGVAAEDQAWWREQLAQAADADGEQLRRWAEQGFERCAARVAPHSHPEQRALCGADLDTLPVILLYRADGVALADARRDLREGTALLADGLEVARAESMLRFSYEGAAPRKDGAARWMRERQEAWVARCLRTMPAGARP